jgi:hypothetical protein
VRAAGPDDVGGVAGVAPPPPAHPARQGAR